ncbi:N-acetylmuramic acid 6-phosphate etherase [Bullifex sp.]|uniref:N-acetylmuramic acid 6-phosphate etherase n=1 Tax=Bullifex sp. TaxID=2815808 RepID=UPI002A7F2E97|nr:N-acetylmuramic acid 6-phosphate etherase [Bullifex sp.]MDD5972146.1 N-acetylmuramic acid 6-phosphate etherase [Spirochaetales bacterium]MDY4066664.1 N-acetylmuramic acid 6-phosphate etherase [Bullifex sp.]
MIDLSHMTTETRNKTTMGLSKMTSLEIISEMNREDSNVPKAIHEVLPVIAEVVDWCVASLKQGGRIIYMGAGTSGRLGVLDAAECPPTFGVSPDMVVGLIAGGEKAFIKAIEGAEDSVELGKMDLIEHNLTKKDVVIGIAASGRTPYVIGGLEYANSIGCNTASISCNLSSEIGKIAKKKIEVLVGPEVLTGSTRLKAGTAQKLILNMISTASMVGIGKCYENLMVDVMQTNEKLKVRAQNILMEVTGIDREMAKKVLEAADGHVKTAIVMVLTNSNKTEAVSLLNKAEGHISRVLDIAK